jgi:hypothetical protein
MYVVAQFAGTRFCIRCADRRPCEQGMARVAHAFDIDLRRGNLHGEVPHLRVRSAMGEPSGQFDDFSCQGRIGKNRNAQPMTQSVDGHAPLSRRGARPSASPGIAAIGGGETRGGQAWPCGGSAGRDETACDGMTCDEMTWNSASSMSEVARRRWAANTDR